MLIIMIFVKILIIFFECYMYVEVYLCGRKIKKFFVSVKSNWKFYGIYVLFLIIWI